MVVAVSLMMKSIRWLRWVNLVGSALFALYGFLIQAWPVFGLNSFIVFINVIYLVQLSSTRDGFSLLEVPVAEAWAEPPSLLGRFLEAHGPDLARFQPDFPRELPADARTFFVLREVLPVSLFVCRKDEAGNQEILVDYAIPAWRDFQNALFVYNNGLASMTWEGTGTFLAKAPVAAHARYLKRIGFRPVGANPGVWSWSLPSRNPEPQV